ncbi:MAG: RNA polymerase sigma factor [Lachnospirales bacterium]
MSYEEDFALVKNALKKDKFSFETLVKKYEKLVYSIAYRMFNNREDAEDITQNVFIKVYNKLDTFNEGQSFKAWISTVTTNSCIDELRKRKNKSTISIDKTIDGEDNEFMFELPSNEITPIDQLVNKERRSIILESICELKKSNKQLIILRDINDLSYEEIALHLDMNIGTVKSKISRSRLKLKNIIMEKMEQIEK